MVLGLGAIVEDIPLESAVYLFLAALGAMFLAVWWSLDPAARSQRLPMPRIRRISWYGIDVFAGFVLLALIPTLVDETLKKAGLYDWLYPDVDEQSLKRRTFLWSSTLAPPLILGLIILGLQQLRGTRLVELGLTRARAAVNVCLGYLTWLLLTPLVLALMYLALYLVELVGGTPTEHPVSLATQQPLMLLEWLLMFASAVVLMPLLEEVLFRGLMLPWQLRGGWQAQTTTAFCALFVAAVGGTVGTSYNIAPPLFVLVILAGLLLVPFALLRYAPPQASAGDSELRRPSWPEQVLLCAADRRAQPLLAVCTNGLFFAAMHSSVWPSPVALVVLGVGLAWLRYRTSSLVASLTLHALFNAVSAAALALKVSVPP
jgi:membrane protease YdiL (CAAX protease family)